MPSPVSPQHGRHQARVIAWLAAYEDATPGVELYDNTTIILGEKSEPQPDGFLIINPARGGQIRIGEDGYFKNGPELVVEVSTSTEAIDLHRKRVDYEKAGVQEYVVVVEQQARVVWMKASGGKLVEVQPDADGIYRSAVFPGLWLDSASLLRFDGLRVRQVLEHGLATPEHAAFVRKLTESST